MPAQIMVLAKTPTPGRVKTRLCPPLSLQQAADVAAAALADTLDAVRRTAAEHRMLVLDGGDGRRGPDRADFEVVPQRGTDLDERLAAAFDDCYARHPVPMLLVGMDTPQLTSSLLEDALVALEGADAVLGAAEDGGWWALGLHRPDARLLRGVPTSRPDTGARQRARLTAAGLRLVDLPVLRDVDTPADLQAVRRLVPASRFAAAVATAVHTAGDTAAYAQRHTAAYAATHAVTP